jgi:hypothetical protein
MIMILTMSPVTFAFDSAITPAGLKASMQNANLLPSPTDVEERAARGNYLPYNGYFEESFSTGGAAGRKARFYIPEGSFVRNYFLTLALPSGTDVEEFLVNSGWIDIADAESMCLMILMPNGDTWGTFAEENSKFTYGNLFGISAKCLDVFLNPPEREYLIFNAQIFVRDDRMHKKSKRPQAKIDRDNHHMAFFCQFAAIIPSQTASAIAKCASVEPDSNWKPGIRVRGADIQGQTVFALGIMDRSHRGFQIG